MATEDYTCVDITIAKCLITKDYRKASEVAEEIVAILKSVGIDEWRYPVIAEIKERYTEGVRCKECKHWVSDEIGRRYCELIDCWAGDTDFCSRAERSEKTECQTE